MEMFDLVDIQRMRHPKLRKFTYESKSLKLKSRIDFLFIAKNLSRNVKNQKFTMQSRLTITQFTFLYLGPTKLLGDQDSGNVTTLCWMICSMWVRFGIHLLTHAVTIAMWQISSPAVNNQKKLELFKLVIQAWNFHRLLRAQWEIFSVVESFEYEPFGDSARLVKPIFAAFLWSSEPWSYPINWVKNYFQLNMDWGKCIICQKTKHKSLQCPANSTRKDPGTGYSTFIKVVKKSRKLVWL